MLVVVMTTDFLSVSCGRIKKNDPLYIINIMYQYIVSFIVCSHPIPSF